MASHPSGVSVVSHSLVSCFKSYFKRFGRAEKNEATIFASDTFLLGT